MDFIILTIGLAMLVGGAESVVRGSVSLGKKLKISLFAIGVVVVAAGTSLPELANCVRAVVSGHPDIATGDVIGSNIANIILIMGATALLCPIRKITQNQVNQAAINVVIALGLIMMSLFMFQFNPVFGVVALILLTLIMVYQVKIGSLNFSDVEEKGEYSMFISGVLIVIGIMLLVYGSKFFVNGAVNIATDYGIPESVIGVSLVAFGTSLPELAVGVLSAVRKRVDFALGNVLGSNIYNVLGVLGVSSFFGRFEFPSLIASFDLYVMTGVIIFITFYMVAMKKLGRLYGVLSLLVYTFYIGYMYI